jgi:hypothetical protein
MLTSGFFAEQKSRRLRERLAVIVVRDLRQLIEVEHRTLLARIDLRPLHRRQERSLNDFIRLGFDDDLGQRGRCGLRVRGLVPESRAEKGGTERQETPRAAWAGIGAEREGGTSWVGVHEAASN